MTLFFSLYRFSEYSNNLMSKRTVARAPRGDCIGCFLNYTYIIRVSYELSTLYFVVFKRHSGGVGATGKNFCLTFVEESNFRPK